MDIPKSVSLSFVAVIIGLYLGHVSTSGTKTQTIRMLDVVLIGPLMIYFGHRAETSLFSILLTFFGATTITYNLKNYMHALHASK
jgi:uncharacterized membrane protein